MLCKGDGHHYLPIDSSQDCLQTSHFITGCGFYKGPGVSQVQANAVINQPSKYLPITICTLCHFNGTYDVLLIFSNILVQYIIDPNLCQEWHDSYVEFWASKPHIQYSDHPILVCVVLIPETRTILSNLQIRKAEFFLPSVSKFMNMCPFIIRLRKLVCAMRYL